MLSSNCFMFHIHDIPNDTKWNDFTLIVDFEWELDRQVVNEVELSANTVYAKLRTSNPWDTTTAYEMTEEWIQSLRFTTVQMLISYLYRTSLAHQSEKPEVLSTQGLWIEESSKLPPALPGVPSKKQALVFEQYSCTQVNRANFARGK